MEDFKTCITANFVPQTRKYPQLKKMNKTDPAGRNTDENDEWFDAHVDVLIKDAQALAYIEDYRFLQRRLVKLLKKPQDIELQKILISVFHDETWGYQPNFRSLLGCYLHLYDLLPSVKKLLFTDGRFKEVLRIYKEIRKS